jgi:hypothetical protein
MSFIIVDKIRIPTDPEAINALPIEEIVYNNIILRIEILTTNIKIRYSKNYEKYMLTLFSIKRLYNLRLMTNTTTYERRVILCSYNLDAEQQTLAANYRNKMTEFYKLKNKIMKKCDKKTKTQKDKKSKWVDDNYQPSCNCPYIHRNCLGDYMTCRICGKNDFQKDIINQVQNREQNINNGLYLRNETTDINIINSLPFDLSKQVVQYI